jgi:hypothetical protein
VNLFNPSSLAALLVRSGYEVLDISTPGRLDVELVRDALLHEGADLSDQPFLRRVLFEEYGRLGAPFQQFLASQGLAGNLRAFARKQ